MGRIHARAGQGRHVIRKALRTMLVATMFAGVAHATEDAKKVDAELLEFLGSIDAEDEGWQEYLEQKPVKPEAKKPPPKTVPAPRTPDPKQVKGK